MENITHVTAQGSKEFGLTNTNKLIRTYEGCVGLKTGSTSKAKFCISAVARRKDISLISVVMAAPDSKTRQKDAAALFDYGFARCSLYTDEKPEKLPSVKVKKGVEETVPLVYEEKFQYLDTEGQPITEISKKRILPSEVKAPVRKGQQAGEVIYYRNGEELGKVRILYADSVSRAAYTDCLEKILDCLWL